MSPVQTPPQTANLEDLDRLVRAACELIDRIIDHAREKTAGGNKIDDHQVLTRKIANLATRVEAAERLLAYAKEHTSQNGRSGSMARLSSASLSSLSRSSSGPR